MSPDDDELDPIDQIAEDFTRRCRAGETPSIEQYIVEYPAHAAALRRLLPAVAVLERHGPRSASPSPTEPIDDPPMLEQIGEFRIIREVGRGGMGIVYEAWQESLKRRVALKILPGPSQFAPKSRERFRREARAVARLLHDHIVPVLSNGEHNGLLFYVMPFIDGPSLEGYSSLAKHPTEHMRWVAQTGVHAALAIEHAHGQGVLHRDIKPANLLLDARGKLWVTDFGLAKLAGDAGVTSTGDLPGTLRYLAPECLHTQADARSDVYSLGLTLYELLLGEPAFPGADRAQLLEQIHAGTLIPPRKLDPSIPKDLETILLKAVAHSPNDRYLSAKDLAEDLGRFLDGRPITARPVGSMERLQRYCRRNRMLAAMVGVCLVLLLMVMILGRLWVLAPPGPPPGLEPPGKKARPKRAGDFSGAHPSNQPFDRLRRPWQDRHGATRAVRNETMRVNSEIVIDRGQHILIMGWLADGVSAQGVGRSDRLAHPHATTGEQGEVDRSPMVAARVFIDLRGPTKVAPNHNGDIAV